MNNSDNINERIISTTYGTVQTANCPWHTCPDNINPDDFADWD